MLYMIGKIFLQGISFDIAYNESVPENMKIVQRKNIDLFSIENEVCETILCHHTHI